MSVVGHDLGAGTSGRRFLIHACLGRGGFGEVYRATMTSAAGVRTEVAVKVLRADIDPGSDSVKRLRDEGRLLGILSHPAILRVHDLVLLQRRVALVTEFVEGEDLDSCLAADPPLPIRPLVQVLGEVAAALDVAWNAPSPQGGPMHLVHRDVKPANVRLGRHGEVKLLDFGIARATNLDREAQTANNAMLGSYLYMAPERFHEEKVEPPSDVYALGCILFEGLTRHRLFEGMTLKQIYGVMLLSRKFNSHVEDRLKLVPSDTVPGVAALLRSLLEVDPAGRPTASQVARQCEDLAETLTGPTLKRWARNREWPHQPQILGSLDGRDLSAESFDPNDPSSELGRDPDGSTTPVSASRSTEPGLSRRSGPGRTPPPSRPAEHNSSVQSLSLAGLLALPTPGENALDAPIPGLVSREMMRPTPSEIAAIRSAEPPARGVRLGESPQPASVRVPGDEPAPPPPRVAAFDAPASTPRSEQRRVSNSRDGETAVADAWFADEDAALDRASELPASVRVTPDPALSATPAIQVRAPTPRSRPRIDIPIDPSDRHDDRFHDGPSEFGGELPADIEPIPGVFDDDPGARTDRNTGAHRQLETRRRQRRALGATIGMALIGLVAIGGLVWWVATSLGDRLPSDVVVPADGRGSDGGFEPHAAVAPAPPPLAPVPVAPAPAPVAVEPPLLPEPVVEAPPEPAPAAAPAPAAKPETKPVPAGLTAAQLNAMVERGWSRVEAKDATAALTVFEEVVKKAPNSAEGYYGRGYALVMLDRNDEAATALCKAKQLGGRDVVRDVTGLLEQNGLACK